MSSSITESRTAHGARRYHGKWSLFEQPSASLGRLRVTLCAARVTGEITGVKPRRLSRVRVCVCECVCAPPLLPHSLPASLSLSLSRSLSVSLSYTQVLCVCVCVCVSVCLSVF